MLPPKPPSAEASKEKEDDKSPTGKDPNKSTPKDSPEKDSPAKESARPNEPKGADGAAVVNTSRRSGKPKDGEKEPGDGAS